LGAGDLVTIEDGVGLGDLDEFFGGEWGLGVVRLGCGLGTSHLWVRRPAR
jgi:hypothetical protein